MGAGVDVGIDAQGDGRDAPRFGGDAGDAFEFGHGFHVKAANARFQRGKDFRLAFGHTGKDGFGSIASGSQHARQFAARDNVKARAPAGK